MHAKSLQSCLTLCNPMDCSPPDSSSNGFLQAGILECVAMPSSRGSNPCLLRLRHWQAGSLPPAPPGKAHQPVHPPAFPSTMSSCLGFWSAPSNKWYLLCCGLQLAFPILSRRQRSKNIFNKGPKPGPARNKASCQAAGMVSPAQGPNMLSLRGQRDPCQPARFAHHSFLTWTRSLEMDRPPAHRDSAWAQSLLFHLAGRFQGRNRGRGWQTREGGGRAVPFG